MRILYLYAFHNTKLKFHHDFIDTDWGMRIIALMGIDILFKSNIHVHGMIKKTAFLPWSWWWWCCVYGDISQEDNAAVQWWAEDMCENYDWYNLEIQVASISQEKNAPKHMCRTRYSELAYWRSTLMWCHYNFIIYSKTIFNSHIV